MLKRMMTGALVLALVLGLAGIATAADPNPWELPYSQDLRDYPDLALVDPDDGTVNVVWGVPNAGFYTIPDGRGLDLGTYYLEATPDGTQGYMGDDIRLDLGDGNLTGTGAVSLTTRFSVGYGGRRSAPGDIEIQNVGNIDTGAFVTSSHVWTGDEAGDITIGSAGNRAGNVRVGSFDLQTEDRGGGGYVDGGTLTIHSDGHVTVGVDDNGTIIPGDINTRALGGLGGDGGDVLVLHAGSFMAGDVIARGHNYRRYGGNIEFIGNAYGDTTPSGTFTANNLHTYNSHDHARDGGDVTIAGYQAVTIHGDILTYTASTATRQSAGNVDITTSDGGIDIGGQLDLRTDRTDGTLGILSLTAGGSGSITLAELDLDLLQSAWLDSGSGVSYIEGALLGFDIDNPDDGLLDAPEGQHIYYDPFYYDEGPLVLGGNSFPNAYLLGAEYTLQSGGVLAPEPVVVPIPEPAGLSLLGMALLGLKRKRRS